MGLLRGSPVLPRAFTGSWGRINFYMSYKTLGIISLVLSISSLLLGLLLLVGVITDAGLVNEVFFFSLVIGNIISIPYWGAIYCFVFAYPDKRKKLLYTFGLIIPMIIATASGIFLVLFGEISFSYQFLFLCLLSIIGVVLTFWFISWVLTHPLYDLDLERKELERWRLITISLMTAVIYISVLILIYNGVLLVDGFVRQQPLSAGPPYDGVDVTSYFLIIFSFSIWWLLAVVVGTGFINLDKKLSEQFKIKLKKTLPVIFFVILIGGTGSLGVLMHFYFSSGRVVAMPALVILAGIFTPLYLISFTELLNKECIYLRSIIWKISVIVIVFTLVLGSFGILSLGFDHDYPQTRSTARGWNISGRMSELYTMAYSFYVDSGGESYVIDGISICQHQDNKYAQDFQRTHKGVVSIFGVRNRESLKDLCYANETGWVAVAELKDPDLMWCVDHFREWMEIPGNGDFGKARPAHMPEEGLSGLEYRERGQGNSPCEQLQEE